MARKATKKTENKTLIGDILDDQTSLFAPHLCSSNSLKNRLHHNISELYRRLGETVVMEDAKTFVKAGAIGDIFDVDASIIRRWAREGKIPAVKLPNGRFVFNVGRVKVALDSQRER